MLNANHSFQANDIYNAIKYLNDREDILNALPGVEFDNSLYLLQRILYEIVKDYDSVKEEIALIQDEEERELFEEEKETIEFKISVINERINEIERMQDKSNPEITEDINNIIFARKPSANDTRGKLYLEEDIDTRWEADMLREFSKCFETVITGKEEKGASITSLGSINKKLAGILHAVGYQARIYYKKLGPNLYYVFYFQQKKKNNARDDIERRWDACKADYYKVLELIKDENKRQELIDGDRPIIDEVREILKSKERNL